MDNLFKDATFTVQVWRGVATIEIHDLNGIGDVVRHYAKLGAKPRNVPAYVELAKTDPARVLSLLETGSPRKLTVTEKRQLLAQSPHLIPMFTIDNYQCLGLTASQVALQVNRINKGKQKQNQYHLNKDLVAHLKELHVAEVINATSRSTTHTVRAFDAVSQKKAKAKTTKYK